MDPEVAFLCTYALVLVAGSVGLERIGRRPTSPWGSRMLAAGRPPHLRASDDAPWPHSEVPGFHAGLGLVVVAAALALTVASAVRHHGPADLALQGFTVALIVWRISRLVSRSRRQSGADGSTRR